MRDTDIAGVKQSFSKYVACAVNGKIAIINMLKKMGNLFYNQGGQPIGRTNPLMAELEEMANTVTRKSNVRNMHLGKLQWYHLINILAMCGTKQMYDKITEKTPTYKCLHKLAGLMIIMMHSNYISGCTLGHGIVIIVM